MKTRTPGGIRVFGRIVAWRVGGALGDDLGCLAEHEQRNGDEQNEGCGEAIKLGHLDCSSNLGFELLHWRCRRPGVWMLRLQIFQKACTAQKKARTLRGIRAFWLDRRRRVWGDDGGLSALQRHYGRSANAAL